MSKKIKSSQRKISSKSAKKAPKAAFRLAKLKVKAKTLGKSAARKAVLKAVAKKALKGAKIAPKARKAMAAKAMPISRADNKLFKKPKIKEEFDEPQPELKPRAELNKEEISSVLAEAYVRHLVIEAAGEHALEIVRHFSNNSSDEDISKKLKIKISDVRAALNKLHSIGIVEYSRQKNSETGWFHYFWYLNLDKMKKWVESRVDAENRASELKEGEYYFCPRCGGASVYEFVSASDLGFRCPTCSTSLDFLSQDKTKELFPVRSFRKPTL